MGSWTKRPTTFCIPDFQMDSIAFLFKYHWIKFANHDPYRLRIYVSPRLNELTDRIYALKNDNIILSDNGLSPIRRHVIIWTNPGLLKLGASGTNLKYNNYHTRNWIWKCRLQNGIIFLGLQVVQQKYLEHFVPVHYFLFCFVLFSWRRPCQDNRLLYGVPYSIPLGR